MVTVVAAVCIGTYDWRAATAFAASSAWGMANLVVWSYICRAILSQAPNRGAKLLQFGIVKIVVISAGLLVMRFFAPLTRNEVLGIIAGITMALSITVLKALGARLTGRDLVTGQPEIQRVVEPVAEVAGSHT